VIRAMLDTNVLASGIVGLAAGASPPAEVIRRWGRREFDLVLSDHVLDELDRTLRKPYFAARISPRQLDQVLWTLGHEAEVTPITVTVFGIATHPEDDLVLAAVASAEVDFLVTGDAQLQALGRFGGSAILSAGGFLEILDRARALPSEREDASR